MSNDTLRTYGYGEGLLSNSMLQAAITCPLKYKLLYLDRVATKDGNWFDATFIGTVVHRCLELHDTDTEAALTELWAILEQYFGPVLVQRTRSLMAVYDEAVKQTLKDGHRWGREYKAPQMTGYWKKNYAGLDNLLSQLSMAVAVTYPDYVLDPPYWAMVSKMVRCIRVWQALKLGEAIDGGREQIIQGEVGPKDARIRMVGTVDRIEDRGDGRIAICDYKTGEWGYTQDKVVNSDQFGLYDRILTDAGHTVVEWVLYDLAVGNVVRVQPTKEIRDAFDRRLATNLRYFKQLEKMVGKGNVEVPVPAGGAFKVGCPCILAETGDCTYVVKG